MTWRKVIFNLSFISHPLVLGGFAVLFFYIFLAPDKDLSPWLILWIFGHTIFHGMLLENRWFEG